MNLRRPPPVSAPREGTALALTQTDRDLLDRCLDRAPGAWNAFVDRFAGLFVHVIRHSAEARAIDLNAADEDEILSDCFVQVLADDMALLRRFAGRSSLATYLAVVARRTAVAELIRRRKAAEAAANGAAPPKLSEEQSAAREVVDELLGKLPAREAKAVRMHHLEGRSYRDVGRELGVSENSVGAVLTRGRRMLQHFMNRQAAGT